MNNYEVYLITNSVTNKKYVGITKRGAQKRLERHFYEASVNKYGMYLHDSIRKHGKENFVVEVLLKDLTHEEACSKEIQLVETCGTLAPNGYNEHKGGKGGCKDASQALRKKLSDARIGRPAWNKGLTKEQMNSYERKIVTPKIKKEKLIKIKSSIVPSGFLGKKHSAETKAKMSEAQQKRFSESIEPRVAWNKGKQLTEEQKSAISERMKGSIPWNKGRRDLPSTWNKGMKFDFKPRKSKEKIDAAQF